MKRILVTCVAITLLFAGVAASADIEETLYTTTNKVASRPWNAANIEALRALDKAEIVKLLNDLWYNGENRPGGLKETDIGDPSWVDLAGDGKYELLITQLTRCCCFPSIYWLEAPGKVREQSFNGGCPTLRDLNSDGKQELIITFDFRIPPGPDQTVAELPLVYRLRDGRYVEASHDFPKYYDTEVLPKLEKDIKVLREEVAAQQHKPKPTPGPNEFQSYVDDLWCFPRRSLAENVMVRATILRLLGRDPEAGLAEAREWMKSPDWMLVEDAVQTLEAIGGHDQELEAAKREADRLEPWMAGHR